MAVVKGDQIKDKQLNDTFAYNRWKNFALIIT